MKEITGCNFDTEKRCVQQGASVEPSIVGDHFRCDHRVKTLLYKRPPWKRG